jgi:hypothetical protein
MYFDCYEVTSRIHNRFEQERKCFTYFHTVRLYLLPWTALKECSDDHVDYYTMWDSKLVPEECAASIFRVIELGSCGY